MSGPPGAGTKTGVYEPSPWALGAAAGGWLRGGSWAWGGATGGGAKAEVRGGGVAGP